MLFLPITRIESAQASPHSLELRLDQFPSIDLDLIRSFLQRAPQPTLLTLRKSSQGGNFTGTEYEREVLIEKLLALRPPFFDLEYDMRPDFIRAMIEKHPTTQFILSYHNFEAVPPDLERIYRSMQRYPVFCYKIAAMVRSTNEALKLLLFAKTDTNVSAICMGKDGSFARVLGPVVGNLLGYACLDTPTAPGQLPVQELTDIYHYPSLNRETAIYGLIGDPVEKSPGHLHHNAVFRKRGLNAVYVKMRVTPEELSEFIPLAKAIGVRGLSVTIPLKEKILPFLDEVDSRVGAINTLLFDQGRIRGTNTDGRGALDAVEKKMAVRGKKVVLLGAGGAARGIAFEASARGAEVLVLNRTVQRAIELGYNAGGLDEVPPQYDILINCSPDPMPIDPQKIRPKTIAMDVVYSPRETEFLKEALARECQIVYGEEMYLNQAALQTKFWVG